MSHTPPQLPAAAAAPLPCSSTLSETDVILGFHALLKAALTQAKADGLLSDDDLAYLHPATSGPSSQNPLPSSTIDIEISGPALCLFFAALRAKGEPPQIEFPLPASDTSTSPHILVLSQDTCPPSFLPFFHVWQQAVGPIQYLPVEHRYDLALMISEKDPISSPVRMDVVNICNDLKRVAIDIAQRRSFQLRFSTDLQHALDSAIRSRPSSADMKRPSLDSRPRSSQDLTHTRYEPPPSYDAPDDESASGQPGPTAAAGEVRPAHSTHGQPPAQPPRPVSSAEASRTSSAMPSAQIIETLSLIRETLFSALGDCFALHPSLREIVARSTCTDSSGSIKTILNEWSSRACFACLCLSILEVALTRIVPEAPDAAGAGGGTIAGIKTVQVSHLPPQVLRASSCPPQLVHLLQAFLGIGSGLSELKDLDDEMAIAAAQKDAGSGTLPQSQLDRLRQMLQTGDTSARSVTAIPPDQKVGAQVSPIQAAAAKADVLCLAINQMAMQIFALPGFQERLSDAIGVLASIHSL
ncbi:hypothetical protein ACQY0O_008399 [Thecaphora frezii]